MDSSVYDDSYYLTGKLSGKSLYENYRWLPNLTVPMCRRITEVCSIHDDDTILDFGCARGYVVRAFRELGYKAYGFDVSAWAIENCDPSVKDYVRLIEGDSFAKMTKTFDWIVCKDVLEHIPRPELEKTIHSLITHARKGIFVVVPLASAHGEGYVVPEYEMDITHVHRLTLGEWVGYLTYADFCTSACYQVRGVKENYSQFERGNGFIFIRRLPEVDAGEE